QNWIRICWMAVQMNGHDRFGSRRNRRFDTGRVYVERVRFDVDQYWLRTRIQNCRDAGDKGKGHSNDFISWLDTNSQQCKMQSASARIQCDALSGSAICREFLLKSGDLGPE